MENSKYKIQCILYYLYVLRGFYMRTVFLDEAVNHIYQACERDEDDREFELPFFFIVGAGVSAPIIKQSKEVIEDCRNTAIKYGRTESLGKKFENTMKEYSHWFETAYPHKKARQNYLKDIIEGKPISPASLSLAHILSSKKIASLVVTPNFDDFISKALNIFGCEHLICDHPQTIAKISGNNSNIEIVHVHGTYWFYDCCNLQTEIMARAKNVGMLTMSAFLSRCLFSKTPIVVGYSGWEKDVIMQSLKERLQSALPHNLYWFCYRESDIDSLPDWLTSSEDVIFVIPKPTAEKQNNINDIQIEIALSNENYLSSPFCNSVKSSDSKNVTNSLIDFASFVQISDKEETYINEKDTNATLSAEEVFQAIIEKFNIKPPLLISNPIDFFLHSVKKMFPNIDEDNDNKYFFSKVVEKLNSFKNLAEQEKLKTDYSERIMEEVRQFVSMSQEKELINKLDNINYFKMKDSNNKEIFKILVSIHKKNEMNLIKHIESIGKVIIGQSPPDKEHVLCEIASIKLVNAKSLSKDRKNESIEIYDEILSMLKVTEEDQSIYRRQILIKALFDKALLISNKDQEKELYNNILMLSNNLSEPQDLRIIALTMYNKAVLIDDKEEAKNIYKDIIQRFGGSEDKTLKRIEAKSVMKIASYKENRDEAVELLEDLIAKHKYTEENKLKFIVIDAMAMKLEFIDDKEENKELINEIISQCNNINEIYYKRLSVFMMLKKILLEDNDELISEILKELINKYDDIEDEIIRSIVCGAMIQQVRRCKIEEEKVQKCIEIEKKFLNDKNKLTKSWVAEAKLTRMMLTDNSIEDNSKKVAECDKIISELSDITNNTNRRVLAKVMYQKLAWALEEDKEKITDEIIDMFNDYIGDNDSSVKFTIAYSLFKKSSYVKDTQEQLSIYNKVINNFEYGIDKGIDSMLNDIMFNKGIILYKELEDVSKNQEGEELLISLLERNYSDGANFVAFSSYEDGDYAKAAELFLKCSQVGCTDSKISLAYMLRRREVPGDLNIPTIEELLEDLIEKKDPHAIVNYALYLISIDDEKWEEADKLIKSMINANTTIDWWINGDMVGEGEKNIVLGWLTSHGLIEDPEGISASERLLKAKEHGWMIPDWAINKTIEPKLIENN